MKVSLVTPWDNAWVPIFKDEVEARGHEFELTTAPKNSDVVIHGWASGSSQPLKGARNVMFLRRYELFDGGLSKVQWSGIDHLVCVNEWIAGVVKDVFKRNNVKTPVSVIYNAFEDRRWSFKVRKPGKKIGMACHIHPKKNLPLALQVLGELPDDYELHIAGAMQDPCTAEYLNHVAKRMQRSVYFYGHVDAMNFWWEGMNYCLSTSISEGNPNNVIEAMAKGIKPVVHCWPGADVQFPPDLLFSKASLAASIIASETYDSVVYKQWVDLYYSRKNIQKVVDLALAA